MSWKPTSLRYVIHRSWFTPTFGWLALSLIATPSPGAAPVLTVPASEASQQVTAPWPKEAQGEPADDWELVANGGSPQAPIAAQRTAQVAADGTVADAHGALLASLPPQPGVQASRSLTLQPPAAQQAAATSPFRFEDLGATSVKLLEGDRPVFVYNHGVITNAKVAEQDKRGARACYLHPVWGLNGEVLTDDFPADHYHHHGIFWAWPHVLIEGREYDLWTYSNIQPRFVRWLYRQTGPAAAVLAVENGWFVGDRQVMTERVWLRAFRSGADERSLDIALVLIPGDRPVALRGAEGKSYGGLTMRYDVWPRRDSIVRAPGHTVSLSGDSLASPEDLSNTRLPWADLSAQFPGSPQRSGAAVFVHPSHPDYPPSWLTRCYGCLCVGYPGVEARTFEAGVPFRLDYRVWIHKSEVDQERLGRQYGAYGAGANVSWEP